MSEERESVGPREQRAPALLCAHTDVEVSAPSPSRVPVEATRSPWVQAQDWAGPAQEPQRQGAAVTLPSLLCAIPHVPRSLATAGPSQFVTPTPTAELAHTCSNHLSWKALAAY